MPRNLYSPRLSDHVVRLLYREAKRSGIPMTRLADELVLMGYRKRKSRSAVNAVPGESPAVIRLPEAA